MDERRTVLCTAKIRNGRNTDRETTNMSKCWFQAGERVRLIAFVV